MPIFNDNAQKLEFFFNMLTMSALLMPEYNPRADGAKRRARVLIPPGYLHPGKRKH
jgi:hypothetical protein